MVAIPFQTAILRRRPRAPAESPLSSGAYPETVSSLLRPSYHTYLNTPFSRLGFPCTIIFYDRHDFPSYVSLIRKSASHPTPFNESARAASRFRYTPFSRNLRRPPRLPSTLPHILPRAQGQKKTYKKSKNVFWVLAGVATKIGSDDTFIKPLPGLSLSLLVSPH
jgi:hypothetical protein